MSQKFSSKPQKKTTKICQKNVLYALLFVLSGRLNVHRNQLPFVSIQLCMEMSVNFSNPSHTALHIQCDTLWDRYNMADG